MVLIYDAGIGQTGENGGPAECWNGFGVEVALRLCSITLADSLCANVLHALEGAI